MLTIPKAPVTEVTIRPPNIRTDPDQMRELLIRNKYDTLPGFDEHNERRIAFWHTAAGIEAFSQRIYATERQPNRHFIRVASVGPRVVGYILGSVVDSERVRLPDWICPQLPTECGNYEPYEVRPLDQADCCNSCDGLMVHPDFQCRKIGKDLFTTVFALMLQQPTRMYPLRSHVAETNEGSRRFHENLGFGAVDTLDPTDEMPARMHVMELDQRSNLGWGTHVRAYTSRPLPPHRLWIQPPVGDLEAT